MTTHVLIGAIAAAVGLVLAILFASVARSPGWRCYRIFALLCVGTALYALGSLPTAGTAMSATPLSALGALNLSIALMIPVLWLLFDAQQEERELALLERVTLVILSVGAATSLLPGATIGDLREIDADLLGIVYLVPTMTWLGEFFVGVMVACLVSIAVRYAARAWHSGESSWLRFGGCVLFVAGAIEESVVVMNIVALPFLGSVGGALGIIFMALDLSTRVARNAQALAGLNDELEQSIASRTEEVMSTREALIATEQYAAIGQLAAGVGHEINNPLSYVQGNLEYIQDYLNEGVEPEDQRMTAVEDALDGVARIRQIVSNLATYARSEPTAGIANVADAVDVAMRVVRPQSKFSMNIELELDELPAAFLDESKLVQVLVNVLLNAAESCQGLEPMPTTVIRGRREGLKIVLEICDRGRGMSPAVLERAFLPATSADQEGGGSGLGLFFLCRSIMEAVDGAIAIESAPGAGTSVRLTLQISPTPSHSLLDAVTSKLRDASRSAGGSQ